jgi:AraC-like DNA-binding protein
LAGFEKIFMISRLICHYAFSLIYGVLLFFSVTIQGQNSELLIDNIYKSSYNEKVSQNISLSLKIADSLSLSSSPELKAKGLIMYSNQMVMQSNYVEGINLAETARVILKDTDDYDLLSRVYGLLSQQYWYTGLRQKSNEYLNHGLILSDKISDFNKKSLIKSRFYTELTEREASAARYDNAIDYQLIGLKYLNAIPTDSLNLGHAYRVLGTLYLFKKDYDLAESYFQKAFKFLPEFSNDRALAYDGFGQVLMNDGRYKEAETFFLKTLDFADAAQHLQMKLWVFNSLADLYEKMENYELANFYRKKHAESTIQLKINTNEFINNDYKKIEEKSTQFEKSNQIKSILISISVLLISAMTFLVFYYWLKRKEDYKKFREIIDQYQIEKESSLKDRTGADFLDLIVEEKETVDSDSGESIFISPETEVKLMKNLERFESSGKFTDKNTSLSRVADLTKMNSRYLSYIIKKKTGKGFNEYIQTLRINYIIQKLKEDSNYLDYKISYMADESGFSSHSSFTSVFKKITGMKPSTFIEFLRKENK